MRFTTNWYWTSCITMALALGCAESSAPPSDVRKVGPALNRLGETRPEPPYPDGQAVDSSIRDSTPAERKAAARQRRRESDAKRKYYVPYEPGKGDSWELRKQDSLRKAQQK